MPPSNLMAGLAGLREAMETAPRVARAKMEQLVAQGERAQMGPDGKPWAPVEGREGKAPEKGAKKDRQGKWRNKTGQFVSGGYKEGAFDPEHHIQYVATIEGNDVVLKAVHIAAPYTRFGTKHMPARPKVPNDDGMGWWEPKLFGAIRAHLRRKKKAT